MYIPVLLHLPLVKKMKGNKENLKTPQKLQITK
jgi:hypothetical protein